MINQGCSEESIDKSSSNYSFEVFNLGFRLTVWMVVFIYLASSNAVWMEYKSGPVRLNIYTNFAIPAF